MKGSYKIRLHLEKVSLCTAYTMNQQPSTSVNDSRPNAEGKYPLKSIKTMGSNLQKSLYNIIRKIQKQAHSVHHHLSVAKKR